MSAGENNCYVELRRALNLADFPSYCLYSECSDMIFAMLSIIMKCRRGGKPIRGKCGTISKYIMIKSSVQLKLYARMQ